FNFYYFRKRQGRAKFTEHTPLSNQEEKVLALILENKTNKEIASALFVSVSTVKTHINNIYKKRNVSSRQEAKNLHSK
ncbi:MAG: DNA-binding CsgD family transcriptional regulator, partial [Patiriisocius sp.]